EQFARGAKNQAIMRNFLRATKSKRGPCFVATAVFADDPYALELTLLRNFRDRNLRPYWLGRRAIYLYYRLSPRAAGWLSRHPQHARITRSLITYFLDFVRVK
ncbi:MAG: CFI-box-CTERM domain-containing protein, partial [Bdellovibrionales bacterium]